MTVVTPRKRHGVGVGFATSRSVLTAVTSITLSACVVFSTTKRRPSALILVLQASLNVFIKNTQHRQAHTRGGGHKTRTLGIWVFPAFCPGYRKASRARLPIQMPLNTNKQPPLSIPHQKKKTRIIYKKANFV